MARFVSPITDIKPNGSVRFFDSNTNADKVTYKDDVESIPNELAVPVDANGNLPNIFFSGSAAVIYLDQFDVQYYARNPVGGERELGDFSPWDAQVSYDLNDIVEGSNNKIYRSLSSGNINNDPTLVSTQWEEIRFIGVWNANIIYSIGVVVQSNSGLLWRSLTATAGNNPASDDGTNWLPAIDGSKVPEIIDLEELNEWKDKSTDFEAISTEAYQVSGASNTVDISLPAIAINDSFIFHNNKSSTFKVQILNPDYTINGQSGSFSAGTDIELVPGNSVQMVASSSTVLDIVGVQV